MAFLWFALLHHRGRFVVRRHYRHRFVLRRIRHPFVLWRFRNRNPSLNRHQEIENSNPRSNDRQETNPFLNRHQEIENHRLQEIENRNPLLNRHQEIENRNPLQEVENQVHAVLDNEDLLFLILKQLPTNLLRENVTYVCPRWANFIQQKLTCSVICQAHDTVDVCLIGLSRDDNNIQVDEHLYQLLPLNITSLRFSFSWWIMSSCDHLILIKLVPNHYMRPDDLWIFNRITRKATILPAKHNSSKFSLTLGYDSLHEVYKLIHLYQIHETGGYRYQWGCQFLELTKDFDSTITSNWTELQLPKLMADWGCFSPESVSIKCRYFYWDVSDENHLLRIDLVTHEVTWIVLPRGSDYQMQKRRFIFNHGDCLMLVYSFQDWAEVYSFTKFKWTKENNLTKWKDWSKSNRNISPFVISTVLFNRFILFKGGETRYSWPLMSFDLKTGDIKEMENLRYSDDERGDGFLEHRVSTSKY